MAVACNVERKFHNLVIDRLEREASGRVIIHFTFLRSGVWHEVVPAMLYAMAGDTYFKPMTPAGDHPKHMVLIMAPTAGVQGTWVWNAPADGHQSIGNDVTVRLGYLDYYCCDWAGDGGWQGPEPTPPPPSTPVPPPAPEPGDPNTGPPTLDEPDDPGLFEPEDPMPEHPPDRFYGPHDAVPPGMRDPSHNVDPMDPTAPGQDPSPNPFDPDPGFTQPITPEPTPYPDGYQPYDPANPEYPSSPFDPNDPNWIDVIERQRRVDPAVRIPEVKPYNAPFMPVQGPELLDDVYFVRNGVIDGNKMVENVEHLFKQYAVVQDPTWIFNVPIEPDEMVMRSFVLAEGFSFTQNRNVIHTIVQNQTGAQYGDGNLYIQAFAHHGGTGQTLRIHDNPVLVRALPPRLGSDAPPPPGYIPPGYSGLQPFCFIYPSWGAGMWHIIVLLLNAQFQPIISTHSMLAPMVPGIFPIPSLGAGQTQQGPDQYGVQPLDTLGEAVRQISELPVGIEPSYGGTYHAYGTPDTFVFYANEMGKRSIVVTTTHEAVQSGFEPVMDIYDATNMSSPVVTVNTRFLDPGGVPVDTTHHVLGFLDDGAQYLATGTKYVAVVRHKYPMYYSRRWVYDIYTQHTPVSVGGTFQRDANGKLTGQLSSQYGQQSLMLLNDRTGDYIYVKSNRIGAVADIQSASRGGHPTNQLSVEYGDEVEIIRPGHALQYNRDGDMIGEGTVAP